MRVKETVTHQGIGGKKFRKEFELTFEEVERKAFDESNIACINFLMRRSDYEKIQYKKFYYGHVGLYGYVLCEDELEGE